MTRVPSLCLVEDDPIMGESLCERFELEGFGIDWHRTAEAAAQAIGRKRYALVISDIRLPDLGGDELYLRLRSRPGRLPPFVFITGYGSVERAVQLLKLGAADYITKPFDLGELVEKARTLAALELPPAPLAALGMSPAMRRIEEMLPRIAKHARTVLITGDSGVGKERVAQELDRLARESAKCPFVAMNCGAVTETLLEAELFGYEKGAFTGAARSRKGFFEQAHCGTLFLDEIGEMPLTMQVKLLRAIQERQITRVGGEAPIGVDLRLFCATNRDLKELVAQGRFREDLYYRINVIHLHIPPLRERKEDILWLARQFLDEFARERGEDRRVLDPRAEQALLGYPWPGNVRELKHTLERACIMTTRPVLQPDDLFESDLATQAQAGQAPGNLAQYLQECERAYIVRMLAQSDGHIGNTAALLGISRKNLWEKMRKLGVAASQTGQDAGRQAAGATR